MAKRILNELLWHPDKSMDGIGIHFVHRGAPGNIRCVSGADVSLEKSFFVIAGSVETRIPYHRIREIRRGAEVLWKKT
ncbi:MAG: RNA repair domain-containing protein [Candidatus Hydrothermarchaeaceae archaeon]